MDHHMKQSRVKSGDRLSTEVPSGNAVQPWLAALLSCVFPGAGLAYLGKWKTGALNLGIAILLPLVAIGSRNAQVLEHIHYLYLVIAVGSAAWAHAQAVGLRGR